MARPRKPPPPEMAAEIAAFAAVKRIDLFLFLELRLGVVHERRV